MAYLGRVTTATHGAAYAVQDETTRPSRVRSDAAPAGEMFCRAFVLRPFVLGSIDGLVTSFVIIAGGLAADVDRSAVILIGFSSLVADGFSMGVSEYLSSRPDNAFGRALTLGVTCFLSFIAFGSVPLIGYTASPTVEVARGVSTALFGSMLLVVALLRAYVSTSTAWRSVAEVLVLGTCAGAIAYGVAASVPKE